MLDIDPTLCPLCGKPNECAVASGHKHCWCFDLDIAEQMLEQIPEAARGVACICRSCATKPSAAVRRLDEAADVLSQRWKQK